MSLDIDEEELQNLRDILEFSGLILDEDDFFTFLFCDI